MIKAYKYQNKYVARRHGFSFKKYKNSVNGKKRWDNLSQIKKNYILSKLKESHEYVKAWELETMTSHDTHDKNKKYNTNFKYTTKGIFKVKPNELKAEKMIKNSLISAFNNGENHGNYMKKKLFNSLVNNSINGIRLIEKKILKTEINNKLNAEIIIKNKKNLSKWIGRN